MKILIYFIISFIISHIIITLLSYILFFDTFNLAAPFLMVQDFLRPIKSIILHNDFNKGSLFKYSAHFTYLYTALIAMPVFFSGLSANNNKGKYGYAKFAKSRIAIKRMGLLFGRGVVLGGLKNNKLLSILFKKKTYDLITYNEALSTILIAPTGGGKTAGFIIPTLLNCDNSIIAFDIKGELYDNTAEYRKLLGQEILTLDFGNPKQSIKYNPFATNELPDKRRWTSYVGNITNILFTDADTKSNHSYFLNTAKDLFKAIILYFLQKDGYATIPQAKSFLVEDVNIIDNLKKILEEVKEKIEVAEEEDDKRIYKHIIEEITSALQVASANDQFMGIAGTYKTQLSLYSDFDVQDVINCKESTITSSYLRKNKVTLYIKIQTIDMKRLSPILTLFIENMTKNLVSESLEDSDNNITYILDEFANIGKLPELIRITSLSRGYRLNQIFVIQALSQLDGIYSQSEKESLLANTAYKIILCQNDIKTATAISDIIGNKTENRISKSSSNNKFKKDKSISESQEGIKLVTPQDILNLEKDKCLILVQRYCAQVIKADIPWYFK
ncbi:MAG: type IV secretory system conjugative DNA transfer family protein [Rickettsiales bacterium]|nr:type IV secretory system conjugative DNA transfer family protein [Rickettsiales bacterium]